ncbi:hypothetical protein Tco_0654524 [Tanacetum coccineum]|uniref:Uncharacterized protein n=1 Tax=Tanacetum coccineum TaxID=301880 RepID=A0ABQ4X4C7_9ASTR
MADHLLRLENPNLEELRDEDIDDNFPDETLMNISSTMRKKFHVGLILLDYCLSHALTATADVPIVYLQQFWRTVSKVPDTEDTIKFMLDTQQFIYTTDMFRDTLYLPVETLENPFVAPANIHTIEAFMNIVGYQGVVDKVSAFFTKNLAQPWQTMFKVFNRYLTTRTSGHDQTKINILQLFHVYPRFIKLIVADLMKKFPNIPKRLKEDYHSIKDDVPLIKETNDFKEYETVFMKVDVPMNQLQPVVSTQEMYRITPSGHRSPTIFASPSETKKRQQIEGKSSSPRKSLKITIKQNQLVEKDDDDSEDRIEPMSHKDNLEVVDDDDDNEREKKDDEMGRVLRRMCRRQANLKPCIVYTIIEDRDAFHSEVPAFISQEFKAHAPAIIEELFKNHEELRRKFEKSSTSNTSCREDDFHSHHDEHQDDDAPLKGEKRVKRSKKSKRSNSARGSSPKHLRKDSITYVSKQQSQHQEWDAWEEENVIDEDEVIPEDVTPELIAESQNVDKRVPTIFDHARMEAILRDSLSNMSRNCRISLLNGS